MRGHRRRHSSELRKRNEITGRKTGICGTDAHIWSWDDWAAKTVPTPLVAHGTCGISLEDVTAMAKGGMATGPTMAARW